jgi:hypothetical protein
MGVTSTKLSCAPATEDPNVAPTAAELEAQERWEYEDLVARYLLPRRLPDAAAMHLSSYRTAQMRRARINDEEEVRVPPTSVHHHT